MRLLTASGNVVVAEAIAKTPLEWTLTLPKQTPDTVKQLTKRLASIIQHITSHNIPDPLQIQDSITNEHITLRILEVLEHDAYCKVLLCLQTSDRGARLVAYSFHFDAGTDQTNDCRTFDLEALMNVFFKVDHRLKKFQTLVEENDLEFVEAFVSQAVEAFNTFTGKTEASNILFEQEKKRAETARNQEEMSLVESSSKERERLMSEAEEVLKKRDEEIRNIMHRTQQHVEKLQEMRRRADVAAMQERNSNLERIKNEFLKELKTKRAIEFGFTRRKQLPQTYRLFA